MTLPRSFTELGYQTPQQLRSTGRRRLMLGMDGPPASGKTEFCLSAPGPGLVMALDRGYDAIFDNPDPPVSRRGDFGFKVFHLPNQQGQFVQDEYKAKWQEFYGHYLKAVLNADVRTIVLDGDTDSYRLQRLAEHGQLSKVPQLKYEGLTAARKGMYNRAFDSGKIFMATNTVKKHYETVYNADGTPKLTDAGNEVRKWDGTYDREGFPDQDYLFQIQTRHFYTFRNPKATIKEFGLEIMKCKPDKKL